MTNKARKQGTQWEADLIKAARDRGGEAWYLDEGGAYDPGDLVIRTPDGLHYIVEAKNRAQMNVHEVLQKAHAKVERASLPHPVDGVVVAWKRLALKEGNTRRSQVGPALVAERVEDWLDRVLPPKGAG